MQNLRPLSIWWIPTHQSRIKYCMSVWPLMQMWGTANSARCTRGTSWAQERSTDQYSVKDGASANLEGDPVVVVLVELLKEPRDLSWRRGHARTLHGIHELALRQEAAPVAVIAFEREQPCEQPLRDGRSAIKLSIIVYNQSINHQNCLNVISITNCIPSFFWSHLPQLADEFVPSRTHSYIQ